MQTLQKRQTDLSDADVYTDIGLKFREDFLKDVCRQIKPGCIIDLGCGSGDHVLQLIGHADLIVAVDRDKTACKMLQKRIARIAQVQGNKSHIHNSIIAFDADILSLLHPLEIDNKNHFLRRIKPDLVYGLALIHHLCIEDGLSPDQVAFVFHTMADDIVIEFVPQNDDKVRELIRNGGQMRPDYSLEQCVLAFRKYYSAHSIFGVPDSDRRLIRFIRQAM